MSKNCINPDEPAGEPTVEFDLERQPLDPLPKSTEEQPEWRDDDFDFASAELTEFFGKDTDELERTIDLSAQSPFADTAKPKGALTGYDPYNSGVVRKKSKPRRFNFRR